MTAVRSLARRIHGHVRAIERGAKRSSTVLRETGRYAIDRDTIAAYWWRKRRNFGDEFTARLVEHITGTPPVHVDDLFGRYRGPVLLGVGSILQHPRNHDTVVWGSGFIGADSTIGKAPSSVRCVRGPLTRGLLLQQGIACPAIYGDPALLYRRYFDPKDFVKSDGLGLVAHFVDKSDPELHRLRDKYGVRVIDVETSPEVVVREICACETIASSSLHGLIVALSYGVPSVWVEFSDRVIGNGFKFRDFFGSIHADIGGPVRVTSDTSADSLSDAARLWPIDLDLDALLAAFPTELRRTR